MQHGINHKSLPFFKKKKEKKRKKKKKRKNDILVNWPRTTLSPESM